MNRSEHLLTIVAEEAVEVAQRATKALRFGLDEVQPGQQLSNLQRLMGEVYDLLGSLEMLHRAAGRHMGIDLDAVEAKKAKVEKFLAYSLELGIRGPLLTESTMAENSPIGAGKFKTAAIAHDGRVVPGGFQVSDYPNGATSADGWAMVHMVGKKAAGRLLDGRTHDEFPV